MVSRKFPPWLLKRLPVPGKAHSVKALMRKKNLFTVCEEARCPNLFECFAQGTATFMIGGDICTRTCASDILCAQGARGICTPTRTRARALK